MTGSPLRMPLAELPLKSNVRPSVGAVWCST
jgi:hypothetical protein